MNQICIDHTVTKPTNSMGGSMGVKWIAFVMVLKSLKFNLLKVSFVEAICFLFMKKSDLKVYICLYYFSPMSVLGRILY